MESQIPEEALTWQGAIVKVLAESTTPLHYREITDRIIAQSLRRSLGATPADYKAATMIPALEAILVEAMEPRQNRKRGDDLAAVEYLQRVDPEIEKKRIKETLDAALNKL